MLPFVKMQSVGNDFVVVDEAAWLPGTLWHETAVALCDRKFGVGADGLLLVGPSQTADLRMRMFNPDGTEDMCGNGLRCVVHRAFARDTISTQGSVETIAGVFRTVVHDDGSITTGMGVPQFAPAEIPMLAGSAKAVQAFRLDVGGEIIPVWAASTGTPHTLVFCDALPGDARFFHQSPLIENHVLFPERTSVMWAVVEPGEALRLRIWERGAGETLGCGTGACASAVLARRSGKINADKITVHSKGGTLHVSWAGGDSDPIFLTGVAHTVYTGYWNAQSDKNEENHA